MLVWESLLSMYNLFSIYNRWVFLTLRYFVLQNKILLHLRPGEGGLRYESDGDAHRKIRIKPLKETNLGVAQVLFDPLKETMLKQTTK